MSETQRSAFAHLSDALDLVPNGVTLESLAPDLTGGDYVACLGRICEEKGYHLALDAARRAGLPLTLAGQVHPYEAHQRYFAREIRPRLDGLRTFVGPVDPAERRDLLAHARCLLVPSLVAETSCLVAMEALACGTPVVALDRGALHEIVTPGENGLLVRTPDPDALAAALGAVGTIARAPCRRSAEKRFAAHAMHERYLQLYQRLTHARERAS